MKSISHSLALLTPTTVECGPQKPHMFFVEVPLQQPKVIIWCGFTAVLFFFEKLTKSNINTVSVTGQRYTAMLQNNIIPEQLARQKLQTITFKEDGALPHIALHVQHLTYANH